MNICVVTQTFPLSKKDNTAPFMYDFARGFTTLGHSVTVLAPYHPKLRPKDFSPVRIIPFRYVWPDKLSLIGFGRTLVNDQRVRWYVYLLSPLYMIFGGIALYRLVKTTKPDVINAHWIIPNGIVAAVVARLTGTPLVITLPGSDVYLATHWPLMRPFTQFSVQTAKTIISNSEQLLKDLGTRGSVISYGVPLSSRKHRYHNLPQIVSAGRPVEKKGMMIAQKVIPNVKLFSNLPIQTFRNKLLSVDIFIAASIRDCRGNLDDASLTVLEAMAAGCAVVVSRLPGYQHIITHTQNGLLVNPADISALRRAVQKLLKDKQLRVRLGRAAQETIRRKFTPHHTARAYLNVFENIR